MRTGVRTNRYGHTHPFAQVRAFSVRVCEAPTDTVSPMTYPTGPHGYGHFPRLRLRRRSPA